LSSPKFSFFKKIFMRSKQLFYFYPGYEIRMFIKILIAENPTEKIKFFFVNKSLYLGNIFVFWVI